MTLTADLRIRTVPNSIVSIVLSSRSPLPVSAVLSVPSDFVSAAVV